MSASIILQRMQQEHYRERFGRIEPPVLRKNAIKSLSLTIEGMINQYKNDKFLSKEQINARVRELKTELRYHKKIVNTCPPYEYPIAYGLFKPHYDIILAVTNKFWKSNRQTTIPPIFGTLATGNVNALSFEVPGSKQSIVVFEDQLFPFCLYLCKIVASSIPYIRTAREIRTKSSWEIQNTGVLQEDPSEIKRHISRNMELRIRFLNFLSLYLFTGRVTYRPFWIDNAPQRELAYDLGRCIIFFALGHEIAHIMAGHEKKQVSQESLKSSQKINHFEYEKGDEHFADVGGLRIALDCITNKFHPDPAVVFCAPIIFFKLNQILDKSVFMLRTGKPTIPIKVERAEPYPPPVERIIYVEEAMKRLVDEQHLHLGMAAMLILETLWKYVPPLLSYRAKHGHVLHKRFNFRFKNV